MDKILRIFFFYKIYLIILPAVNKNNQNLETNSFMSNSGFLERIAGEMLPHLIMP